MLRIPTHGPPTHPGEMLLEEFLKPLGISQKQLAEALDMPYQHLSDIVNQRRGINASTALHLAHFFRNSVGFWMNLQTAWDVYHAQQQEGEKIKYLKSLDDILPQTLPSKR
ncbi:MAG: HigA family addiction module antitoxin [Deinococcota bacterium]